MIKTIFTSILFSSLLMLLQAQPVAQFKFDNCDGTDATGNYSAFVVSSQPCDCGVDEESINITSPADVIAFDSAIIEQFNSDFTFSFYARFDDMLNTDNADLFSIQSECNRDSTVSIRYFPESKRLLLEIAFNIGNIRELSTTIDPNLCWHHIAFGISGNQIFLYADGNIRDSRQLTSSFIFNPTAVAGFSNSPCQGMGFTPINAKIDEVELYDQFLSESDLQSLDYYPDRISARDTTIFQGDSVALNTGGTCASTFFWEPETSLDNPLNTSPIAMPSETTNYIFTVNHGDCVSRDSVLIRVIAQDEIDCANLLLPKAFTPNNDGLNDAFGISNAYIIEELKSFQIFDKSGAKMFETSDKNQSWEGFFSNQPVNSSSMLYRVEYLCQGESYVKFDEFIIIR